MGYSPHARPTPHNIRVRLAAACRAVDRSLDLLQLHPHLNRMRHRVALYTAYSAINSVLKDIAP